MQTDLPEIRDWRLHIGAHKTATTHLQDLLQALRPDLEKAGIGFATLEHIRPVRAIDLRRRRPAVWLGGRWLRAEIERRLAARVMLQPRMVLSYEDLLGTAAAPMHPRFYPRAGRRIGALTSALARGGRGSLWLSVRSLEQFLPAAYATALKHGVLPFDADTLRTRALAAPPNWAELVARLRRVAPGVPITVWDYADYRANHVAIAAELTGLELHTAPDIPDPPTTRTPDAAAICAAEALDRRLPPRAREIRVGEIYEAAIGPRFTLFSEAESDMLHCLHHRQLAQIATIDGVRLLSF